MSGFACMECGHKFRTIAAAEKAAFGPDGCPKCGGADIDEGPRAGEARSQQEIRQDISDRAVREAPDAFDAAYERARSHGWED